MRHVAGHDGMDMGIHPRWVLLFKGERGKSSTSWRLTRHPSRAWVWSCGKHPPPRIRPLHRREIRGRLSEVADNHIATRVDTPVDTHSSDIAAGRRSGGMPAGAQKDWAKLSASRSKSQHVQSPIVYAVATQPSFMRRLRGRSAQHVCDMRGSVPNGDTIIPRFQMSFFALMA